MAYESRYSRGHAKIPGSFVRGAGPGEVGCGAGQYHYGNWAGQGCTLASVDNRRLGCGGHAVWGTPAPAGCGSTRRSQMRTGFAGGFNGKRYNVDRSGSYGFQSPRYGSYSGYGRQSPFYERLSPSYGSYSGYGRQSPLYERLSPRYGSYSGYGRQSPIYERLSPRYGSYDGASNVNVKSSSGKSCGCRKNYNSTNNSSYLR